MDAHVSGINTFDDMCTNPKGFDFVRAGAVLEHILVVLIAGLIEEQVEEVEEEEEPCSCRLNLQNVVISLFPLKSNQTNSLVSFKTEAVLQPCSKLLEMSTEVKDFRYRRSVATSDNEPDILFDESEISVIFPVLLVLIPYHIECGRSVHQLVEFVHSVPEKILYIVIKTSFSFLLFKNLNRCFFFVKLDSD